MFTSGLHVSSSKEPSTLLKVVTEFYRVPQKKKSVRHDLWCLRLAARTYESPGLEALGTDDVERLGNGEMHLVGRTA